MRKPRTYVQDLQFGKQCQWCEGSHHLVVPDVEDRQRRHIRRPRGWNAAGERIARESNTRECRITREGWQVAKETESREVDRLEVGHAVECVGREAASEARHAACQVQGPQTQQRAEEG